MDKYIDMHIHTAFSDGVMTPKQVVQYAILNKISTISITDHNNIDGLLEVSQICSLYDVNLIPGIEIDVEFFKEIQILGYNFDINCKPINDLLNIIKINRIKESIILLRKLKRLGIEVDNRTIEKKILTFHSIIYLLIQKGYAVSREDAIEKFFSSSKPLCIETYRPSVEDCIKSIKDSCGYAVLAHPIRITNDIYQLEEIVKQLIEYGLGGIECYHPEHSDEFVDLCLGLSNKYNLKITGGSDCHNDKTSYLLEHSLLCI